MIKIPNFDASGLALVDASYAPYAPTVCSALAAEQVKRLDEIIRIEINQRLGTDAWMISDLAGRVRIEKVDGETHETYVLDGKPLLQVWPPTVDTKNDGVKVIVTVTQEYRTFGEQNPTGHAPARSAAEGR